MTDAPAKKSDLGVRTLSAIVMLAVAGVALWLGGWWWLAFVLIIAVGVLWEWNRLISAFSSNTVIWMIWSLAGLGYVSLASYVLAAGHGQSEGVGALLMVIGAVICTDIGAYIAGRAIGGPKIAPAISPSKTWAGLVGGMLGASAAIALIPMLWMGGFCQAFYPPVELPPGRVMFDGPCSGIVMLAPIEGRLVWSVVIGSLLAVIAQAGDFFESWMKRRAGVKDSSNLIPGHGGLFDRVDGLLAVSFVLGLISVVGSAL
jgi:phosphatidate cytidylyltransferase